MFRRGRDKRLVKTRLQPKVALQRVSLLGTQTLPPPVILACPESDSGVASLPRMILFEVTQCPNNMRDNMILMLKEAPSAHLILWRIKRLTVETASAGAWM